MTTEAVPSFIGVTDQEYKRRIWAWTMYDWANSAFATTVLAAVLPIYFSQVAGTTLPSPAIATAYWSAGLFISLLIAAIISPILGTVSDVMRGKKRFLAIFTGIGIIGTALLVFVGTGDWLLASILAILGRIGFSGANVFYDALLPHVAREEERDHVSARGYALGYLGGGILLAINVVMIQLLPDTWGPRLSFLSVAIWWAVFSIPVFVQIPEPPAAMERLRSGRKIVSASFKRLGETLRDLRRYRELSKFVLSYLIYIDGIGTIIGVAAIYGAELGFGSVELILALLLVQFVGIPFSLIFGRLPSRDEKNRPFFLAFLLFNVAALPLVGVAGVRLLPAEISGVLIAPYRDTSTAHGQGVYQAQDERIQYTGVWQAKTLTEEELGTPSGATYLITSQPGAGFDFPFYGQEVTFTYSVGPDHGIWQVYLDGKPLLDEITGNPITIDGYNPTFRYEVTETFKADAPGEHTLSVINSREMNPDSQGTSISLAQIEILPPIRQSNLGVIIGLIAAIQLLSLIVAQIFGAPLFSNLAKSIDTKRSILLALVVYTIIAIWGFFLNSVIEFWFLAWMVAMVQGGSQALSRSLFSHMSPAAKSGEFFGLFGVMEKFATILGPFFFAFAVAIFDSSRPAILSLIAFFIVGGLLLIRVDVAEGRRVAREEDAKLFKGDVGV